MRSLRSHNLTIQSIRLEIFEKSNWISKRFAPGQDEDERERIFLPSRRYVQQRPKVEGKGERDRVVSEEIEKVIYRSVFMKQAYERDKRRQYDNSKDLLEVHSSLKKSKTSLKIQKLDLRCKHLSNRNEIFINIDTQGKNDNKRKLRRMQKLNSITEKKYSTQPDQEILIQRKSWLLAPLTQQQELQLKKSVNKKRKRPELLRHLSKRHKFSLKSKQTQLSPWKSDIDHIQTVYPFK